MATGPRRHPDCQFAGDAETGPASCKPEEHRLRFVVGHCFGRLDGSVQTGFSDVETTLRGIGSQKLQQGTKVQVVVVIHMAEPALSTGQERVKFRSHLAGERLVAMLVRAVGNHKPGTQLLPEVFVLLISEEISLAL